MLATTGTRSLRAKRSAAVPSQSGVDRWTRLGLKRRMSSSAAWFFAEVIVARTRGRSSYVVPIVRMVTSGVRFVSSPK